MRNLEKNLETLNGFLQLEENWNGYGASPFSENLIEKCKKIIHFLEIQPDVFPTARNSIQFEYEKTNHDYLEFEIFDDRIEVFKQMINGDKEDYEIENTDKMNEVINQFYS